MTTSTNAVHMPVNMDPAAYEYVGAYDNQPEPGSFLSYGPPQDYLMNDGSKVMGTNWANAEYSWLKGLLRTSKTSRFEREEIADGRGSQCDHCGAHIRYVAVLRHTSGDHIAVGETCLDGRFSLVSKAQFDKLRKASADARAEMKIRKAALEFLDGLDDAMATDMLTLEANVDMEDPATKAGRTHHIVSDIRRKLYRYGDISQGQVALVVKIGTEMAEKVVTPEVEEIKVESPEGKTTVEGVIVSLKWKETDFGTVQKMTVKVETPEGIYLVWGSVPSSINPEVKDTVRFTATFERSSDKVGFSFFKRPSKAEIVKPAVAAPLFV